MTNLVKHPLFVYYKNSCLKAAIFGNRTRKFKHAQ